jgi:hypothetical protein
LKDVNLPEKYSVKVRGVNIAEALRIIAIDIIKSKK